MKQRLAIVFVLALLFQCAGGACGNAVCVASGSAYASGGAQSGDCCDSASVGPELCLASCRDSRPRMEFLGVSPASVVPSIALAPAGRLRAHTRVGALQAVTAFRENSLPALSRERLCSLQI